jgi:ABC-type dipeptide/oligopeptide/nickel transport system permease component
MLRFVVNRLLVTALVIAVTSMVAFSLVHLTGDPAAAMAGENAAPEDVEAIRRTYGFDRPIWEQYLTWVGRFLAGDFGRSHYLKLGVGEVLAEHMPVTATLGVLALAFALGLSIPLGVAAALRPNTIVDRVALWIAVAGQALPSFLFALGLIYVFGVLLRWLPVSGDATCSTSSCPRWRSAITPRRRSCASPVRA